MTKNSFTGCPLIKQYMQYTRNESIYNNEIQHKQWEDKHKIRQSKWMWSTDYFYQHPYKINLKIHRYSSIFFIFNAKSNFFKIFKIKISSRKEWKVNNAFREYAISMFTDKSKKETSIGSGILSDNLNISVSLKLPNA